MQQDNSLESKNRMNLALQSPKKKIFSYSILFAIILSYVSFSRNFRAIACFALSLAYLPLIDKNNLFKCVKFVKDLYLRKNLAFSSLFISKLSLKNMIFPSFLEVAGIFCFVMLFVSKLLKKLVPFNNCYGLFIPIIFISFAQLLTRFLSSNNLRILKWKQFFIKKIYRQNAFLVKAYVLAGYVLIIGLIFSYSLFAFKSSLYSLEWYPYSFFDKRVVFVTYFLCLIGFLFTPYIYYSFLNFRSIPVPIKNVNEQTSFLRKIIYLGIAFLIATYYWGPPFNAMLYTIGPDTHEVVHLASLLGIEQGRLPFTEAQIQYGPGSQFFQYLYLKKYGFNLLSFREVSLLFHYIFVLIYFVCIWFYFRPIEAAIISIFSIIFTNPLSLFEFNAQGAPVGFFGWFNGFRYLSSPILSIAMAYLFVQVNPSRAHAFCIGCIYGFLLYMAQENFSCGILTLILGCVVAYAGKYIKFQTLKSLGFYFLLGVLLSISIVFGFYAYHGQLGEFIRQYFRASSLIVQGYTNTSWSSGFNDPAFLPYILTPVILFIIGFYVLYIKEKKLLSENKNWLRIILLTISAISLHQVSLLRADSSHFIASCLSLPILFGLIFYNMIKTCLLSKREKVGYISLFILLLTTIYPSNFNLKTFNLEIIRPSKRYSASLNWPNTKDQIYFEQFGFYRDPNSKSSSYNDTTTAEFVAEMKIIKNIVGDRVTIVGPVYNTHTASIYFFANLKIGTKMTESVHSVLNNLEREELLQEIRNNPIDCLIIDNLQEKETIVFMQRFPKVTITERFYNHRSYCIVCKADK